jgi:hypothetical protein
MKTENIIEIGINEAGQLFIKPEKERFVLIYRSASEVHWNDVDKYLFSPKPREWSYLDWFRHIVSVVKEECDCELVITPTTSWNGIADDLHQQILEINNWLF